MAKKVLYRSLIQIEVLSEEPIDENMSIDDVQEECNSGSYSGVHDWIVKNKVVVGKRAANLTIKQGSDPEFFMMDENGNELED